MVQILPGNAGAGAGGAPVEIYNDNVDFSHVSEFVDLGIQAPPDRTIQFIFDRGLHIPNITPAFPTNVLLDLTNKIVGVGNVNETVHVAIFNPIADQKQEFYIGHLANRNIIIASGSPLNDLMPLLVYIL